MSFRKAFTLIELLVVIAIVALLMSVLMPALKKAKEQAQSLVCGTRLKSLAQADFIYATDQKGFFPIFGMAKVMAANWQGDYDLALWRDYLLPYVGKDGGSDTSYLGSNKERIFNCPADKRKGDETEGYLAYSYAANMHCSPYLGMTVTPRPKLAYPKPEKVRQPSMRMLFGDYEYRDHAAGVAGAGLHAFSIDGVYASGSTHLLDDSYRHSDAFCMAMADGHIEKRKEPQRICPAVLHHDFTAEKYNIPLPDFMR